MMCQRALPTGLVVLISLMACGGSVATTTSQRMTASPPDADGGAPPPPDDGGSNAQPPRDDAGAADSAPPPEELPPTEAYPWLTGCAATPPSTPFAPPPLPSGSFEARRTFLEAVGAGMVGNWRGIATTPWISPYAVAMTFGSKGGYSARRLDKSGASPQPAFYYGTDDDTPLKQYRLEDVSSLGRVHGTIDIVFDYGGAGYGTAAWQGRLDGIVLDSAGDRLRFEFRRSDGYGPVAFDLWRCN